MTSPGLRQIRLLAVALTILLCSCAVVLAAGAEAGKGGHGGKGGKGGKGKSSKAFVPPNGKVYAGVSDTGQGSDYREYRKATRAHPAVMQSFEAWGYVPKEAIGRWDDTRTRGMISLSTSPCWSCEPVISAQSIAAGKGDRYLLALSKALAERKEPTYIRLLPEMNGHWNGYCAFNGGGTRRPDAHSTANFKLAWKRIVLIVRGGKRGKLEGKLRKLGMPKLQAKTKQKLPAPKVAFGWVPQSAGSPDVKGNQPGDYFPGYDYVDWVGADIYGKFPNFDGISALYRKYRKAPFMIGEWAPWGRDDPGFAAGLFDWIDKHKRTKMAVYYQGFGEGADNEFELSDYPRSRSVIRKRLNSKRFLAYTPENEKRKGKPGKGGGKKGGGRG